MRVHGELSSFFFALKIHFKGNTLYKSIYNQAYPYRALAKREKGVYYQQFPKQTLG